MKIRPVGAELWHVDGANSRFSKFCECNEKRQPVPLHVMKPYWGGEA